MSLDWQALPFDSLNPHQLYAVLRLRQEVFVVEQACVYQDLDDLDQEAIHILCWEGPQLLAYQRCLRPGLAFTESALGRIVVSPLARGRQLGRDLVQRGIDHNVARWPESPIQIGAQAHLEAFYASLGFVSTNDRYVEDGIPHLHMIWRS